MLVFKLSLISGFVPVKVLFHTAVNIFVSPDNKRWQQKCKEKEQQEDEQEQEQLKPSQQKEAGHAKCVQWPFTETLCHNGKAQRGMKKTKAWFSVCTKIV